ncbi:MAG TPA: hypothetical protein VM844_11040 [Miltoncostaeaceae bacterium]|nr:hypothetical protein [Miltoncostaeaceae bacterium]
MRRGLRTVVGTALAAGLLIGAPVAIASHGGDDPPGSDDNGGGNGGGNARDVRVSGTCTLRSTAKLKLSPEDGRVEVEFEVDENRNGKTWNVVMNRNGNRVVSRKAVTRAPSGSFEARAVIAAGAPKTTVTAVARRAATREVCRATATL